MKDFHVHTNILGSLKHGETQKDTETTKGENAHKHPWSSETQRDIEIQRENTRGENGLLCAQKHPWFIETQRDTERESMRGENKLLLHAHKHPWFIKTLHF